MLRHIPKLLSVHHALRKSTNLLKGIKQKPQNMLLQVAELESLCVIYPQVQTVIALIKETRNENKKNTSYS